MKTQRPTSFHLFCASRMIPTDIEIKFVVFVKDYLKSNYGMDDDTVFQYFERSYGESEIQEYWLMYIKNIKLVYESMDS